MPPFSIVIEIVNTYKKTKGTEGVLKNDVFLTEGCVD